MAWHGIWHGMAWHGMAWHGMALGPGPSFFFESGKILFKHSQNIPEHNQVKFQEILHFFVVDR